MNIKKLYVRNFRNIREQEFLFHDNLNVLCGNNAQGKTNLCEAISLCMGPSFKGSRQSSYIPFSLDQTREKLCIKIWFTTGISDNENVVFMCICFQAFPLTIKFKLNKFPKPYFIAKLIFYFVCYIAVFQSVLKIKICS